MNSDENMKSTTATRDIKSFIHKLGIDIVGIAELSDIVDMPAGLKISLSDFFKKYPYAIVIGAQYGKLRKKSSGKEAVLFLERIVYDVMEYIEQKGYQYLVIHPEDEYDPDNRMGLLSLKVLAKQAGIGWQGRSLLVVSPEYGPVHRLIAVLTNMELKPDKLLKNRCGDCTACIAHCPKKSLSLIRFDDHPDSRQDVLNIETCLGDHGCTVCILECPYFKRASDQNRRSYI